MGDAAASGGYYIAAHADRVFAQPGTLTGSIGVIAGKVNVGELLKRYSFTVDAIDTYGPNVRALR